MRRCIAQNAKSRKEIAASAARLRRFVCTSGVGSIAADGRHLIGFELRLHAAVHDVEQHDDPVLLVEFQDLGHDAVERATGDLHRLAHPVGRGGPHHGAVHLAGAQSRDEVFGDGGRVVAEAHERAHAHGRQDRPPAHAGVDADEDVAGEKWAQHHLHAARVRPALADQRAIGGEALAFQVLDGDGFAVGVRRGDHPGHLGRRDQSHGMAMFSVKDEVRIRTTRGT